MNRIEERKLRDLLDPYAKQIFYWCSKYDMSFPRSCDIVSKYLLFVIKDIPYIMNKYDISVVRGHYIVDEEDACEDFYLLNRGCPCRNCSCDAIYQHSYLLFKHKMIKECFIVDYTHYQFNEDFGDLEETLLNKKMTKDEIFSEIAKYSYFVNIREKHRYLYSKESRYDNYEFSEDLKEMFTEATTI